MGGKVVLTGCLQVCKVLAVTKGNAAVLWLSASRLVSTTLGVAGEEVIQWGNGLVEESVVRKVKEGNGIEAEEGRLSAVVGIVASPGPDSVLENGLTEMAPGTPDVAKEAVASDKEGVSVLLAKMVSAEDSISMLR